MSPAVVEETAPLSPRFTSRGAKPMLYWVEYTTSAVVIARVSWTADDSFAAILEAIKLGMAIAVITRMIVMTIRSSISENPDCFLLAIPFDLRIRRFVGCQIWPGLHLNQEQVAGQYSGSRISLNS